MPRPLILASASPRRRDLLSEYGYDFSVVPAAIAERQPAHFTPAEVALLNAHLKARDVARSHPQAVVLGVDTLVAFEGQIFGKPADRPAAFTMLNQLNGRAHFVHSGVWLTCLGAGKTRSFSERTAVYFRQRSEADLRAYLARIDPLDKAGAYAAQNDEGEMIARTEGSKTNVIGLPMEKLAVAFREIQDW